MTQELKPCPFCGGEATFREYDEAKPDQSFGLVVNHIEGCFLHQAMTMEDYRTMLASWNTRPAPDMAAVVEASLADVFAQAIHNHTTYSDTGSKEQDIRFFALGLAGEAGEVANFVKKRWRDGDGHDDDLRKECADVFAYNIMLAWALGMTPQDLIDAVLFKQRAFVAKMEARQQ